ncbi:hypothetical protein DKX38_002557 [Salix brachista]|uniref:K-box domain-containing protein n=1 Tax=Salix brachista TaxID=2182728 RepID=A0A5N5NMK2_9ROSI|nr:hypothetical protein DKX38_002557 [Salix brachista]
MICSRLAILAEIILVCKRCEIQLAREEIYQDGIWFCLVPSFATEAAMYTRSDDAVEFWAWTFYDASFFFLMKDVLARYNLHSNNLDKINQPSLELQLENSNHMRLSKEISEKTHQLRRMRGEDLQGLNIEELQQMEKMLEVGLSRVLETKGERVMNEISTLERKVRMLQISWISKVNGINSLISSSIPIMQGVQLLEENKQLKQKIAAISKGKEPALVDLDTAVQEEGMSSESTANVCSCSSGPPVEDDSSDTSLKLG